MARNAARSSKGKNEHVSAYSLFVVCAIHLCKSSIPNDKRERMVSTMMDVVMEGVLSKQIEFRSACYIVLAQLYLNNVLALDVLEHSMDKLVRDDVIRIVPLLSLGFAAHKVLVPSQSTAITDKILARILSWNADTIVDCMQRFKIDDFMKEVLNATIPLMPTSENARAISCAIIKSLKSQGEFVSAMIVKMLPLAVASGNRFKELDNLLEFFDSTNTNIIDESLVSLQSHGMFSNIVDYVSRAISSSRLSVTGDSGMPLFLSVVSPHAALRAQAATVVSALSHSDYSLQCVNVLLRDSDLSVVKNVLECSLTYPRNQVQSGLLSAFSNAVNAFTKSEDQDAVVIVERLSQNFLEAVSNSRTFDFNDVCCMMTALSVLCVKQEKHFKSSARLARLGAQSMGFGALATAIENILEEYRNNKDQQHRDSLRAKFSTASSEVICNQIMSVMTSSASVSLICDAILMGLSSDDVITSDVVQCSLESLRLLMPIMVQSLKLLPSNRSVSANSGAQASARRSPRKAKPMSVSTSAPSASDSTSHSVVVHKLIMPFINYVPETIQFKMAVELLDVYLTISNDKQLIIAVLLSSSLYNKVQCPDKVMVMELLYSNDIGRVSHLLKLADPFDTILMCLLSMLQNKTTSESARLFNDALQSAITNSKGTPKALEIMKERSAEIIADPYVAISLLIDNVDLLIKLTGAMMTTARVNDHVSNIMWSSVNAAVFKHRFNETVVIPKKIGDLAVQYVNSALSELRSQGAPTPSPDTRDQEFGANRSNAICSALHICTQLLSDESYSNDSLVELFENCLAAPLVHPTIDNCIGNLLSVRRRHDDIYGILETCIRVIGSGGAMSVHCTRWLRDNVIDARLWLKLLESGDSGLQTIMEVIPMSNITHKLVLAPKLWAVFQKIPLNVLEHHDDDDDDEPEPVKPSEDQGADLSDNENDMDVVPPPPSSSSDNSFLTCLILTALLYLYEDFKNIKPRGTISVLPVDDDSNRRKSRKTKDTPIMVDAVYEDDLLSWKDLEQISVGHLIEVLRSKSATPSVISAVLSVLSALSSALPSLVVPQVIPLFTHLGASSQVFESTSSLKVIEFALTAIMSTVYSAYNGTVPDHILAPLVTSYDVIPITRRFTVYSVIAASCKEHSHVLYMKVLEHSKDVKFLNELFDVVMPGKQLELMISCLQYVHEVIRSLSVKKLCLTMIATQLERPEFVSAWAKSSSALQLEAQQACLDLFVTLLKFTLPISRSASVNERKRAADDEGRRTPLPSSSSGTGLVNLVLLESDAEYNNLLTKSLECTTKLLSVPGFVAAVNRLLAHPMPVMRYRGLELLGDMVTKTRTSLSRHDIEVYISMIPTLRDVLTGTASNTDKQMALLTLEILARNFGAILVSTQHQLLSEVVKAVVPLLGNKNMSVRGSALLLMSVLIQRTPADCETSAADISHAILNELDAYRSGPSSKESVLLILSAMSCCTAFINKMPAFASSNVLEHLVLDVFHTGQAVKAKSDEVISAVCTKILAPNVINEIVEIWNKSQDNVEACIRLLNATRLVIDSVDKRSFAAIRNNCFAFLITSLDNDHGTRLAKYSMDCFVAFVMKTNEIVFKPLYLTLVQWAVTDSARQLQFLRLMARLTKEFKSIVAPYVVHIWDMVIAIIKSQPKSTTCGLALDVIGQCALHLDREHSEVISSDMISSFVDVLRNEFVRIEGVDRKHVSQHVEFFEHHMIKAMVSLMPVVPSEREWSAFVHSILLGFKSEHPSMRLASTKAMTQLAEAMGENYTRLVPEVLPSISELLEDSDDEVSAASRTLVLAIEKAIGERIDKYME